MDFQTHKKTLETNGFSVIPAIYTDAAIAEMIDCIESVSTNSQSESFIKTKKLFAIRQLLIHVPTLERYLFNDQFLQLLESIAGKDYFLSKAIYFNKPKDSNWFVPYHQDLSISVDRKTQTKNYTNWTFKRGQFGVQPPLSILEKTITVRIHLDDTDEYNGALKVIPQSHLQGICRVQTKNLTKESERICRVEKGGIMLMKPLTFHASNRTLNDRQRRVIHLEFCNQELAEPLEWLEKNSLCFL